MKIALETIPVWDGLNSKEECFICKLMEEAEKDALSYYLSSAVMTPEVRVETNTFGFCNHHMRLLAKENKPQVLSLIMDTYYEENKKYFSSFFSKAQKEKKSKNLEKMASSFSSIVKEREKGCLICTRMEDRLYRYSYTVCKLFEEDSSFRKELENSKGFCLEHTLKLFSVAPDAIKGEVEADFYKTLFSLLEKNLDRVQKDDWWMSQMYKSENKGKSWRGCEDAQKRAVYKLVGKVEIYDPIKNKKSKI